MKKLLIILLLCFSFTLGWGAIIEAESASEAHVTTAIASASTGDTVVIPSGEETWTELSLNKGITLQGAGIGNTIINGSGTTRIMGITLSSDVAVRVTGIDFRFSTNANGGTSIIIYGKTDGSYAYSSVRIDHCKFTKGTRSIYPSGWIYGVIDHCEFLNNNISIGPVGDNNHSWGRSISPGGSDSLFIEDNTFIITNDAEQEPNELIYHQEGGRSVVRYNTFDGSAYSNGNCLFYDSHGNQKLYADPIDFRGQPLLEVYENTFAVHHTYRFFYIRGGSILIYNNILTQVSGAADAIVLTEEEAWQSAWFDPLDTVWPAEDQINNSYFWGNTLDASPVTISDVNITGSGSTTFIQEDRDFWMHVPQSSGGYEYYDDRQGAAGNGADGTLNWDGDHANAHYPYTAYTYPHPLIKGPSDTATDITLVMLSSMWFPNMLKLWSLMALFGLLGWTIKGLYNGF